MNRRGFGRFGMGALAISAWRGAAAQPGGASGQDPWVVYYKAEEPPRAFAPYKVIVLDGDVYPPLAPLRAPGKVLLGYISLGEVEEGRAHFREVEAEGILLMRNEHWQESRMIDLRDPRWRARVVERLVPEILKRGFDGIFIDTLDNAAHLERLDPARFGGMTAAAADLVRAIRTRHPGSKIMLNRAFEIVPAVEGDIDYLLGEAIFAGYDFKRAEYGLVRSDINAKLTAELKAAKARRPALGLFTLDYWDPGNPEGIARIYRIQRAHGFAPYVATVALDRIVPEPVP